LIHLIACVDSNSAIGNKGELLTKPPLDFKHFKKLTTNNFVVFGRKTYEEIGRPLSDRQNIVITSQTNHDYHPEVSVYPSVQDVLFDYINYAEKEVDLFICGGERVYKEFMEHADFIHLTIVDYTFPDTDTFFPKFNLDEWTVISNVKNPSDEKYPHDYYFVTYKKK
jgi:dihydrofolate reductase